MKTILLKFAGPMQSWGTNSNFENRHTDFYPSKSGVIGMIAASLGYHRDEDEKISKLNELSFAVRVDQPGNLLNDYHIARKFKKNGSLDRNYVTNRYYLEDAVFVVAISYKDDILMAEIENSLKSPWFQTFLGRRSLPLTADFFLKSTENGLIDSLSKIEWQASKWYKDKTKEDAVKLEIYSDFYEGDAKQISMRKDRVVSFSQMNRQFNYRYESVSTVEVSNRTFDYYTTHDVFESVGD
ncbi:MAG: type I-E CRISPR-associated protein Cas5/CasD [Prevotellaceae bacterium]|nr:type I-E CRISPR-associated protein Cas5/CasD [Prevotellaceae bacterium]